MSRLVRPLSWMLVAVAVLLGGVEDAQADPRPPTATDILARLGDNVRRIDKIGYTIVHDAAYVSNVSATGFTFRDVRTVDYDATHEVILVTITEPIQRSEKFDDEELPGPETKAVFTGYPLWIIRPELLTGGWNLSLDFAAPAGHVVVRGVPVGTLAAGFHPRVEALVDTVRNRVVSVTGYADSGEVERTIGFENYQSFGGGAVVLPLTVRAAEFARLNRLEAVDQFTSMKVDVLPKSGGKKP